MRAGEAEEELKVEVGMIAGLNVVGSIEGYGESMGFDTQEGVSSLRRGMVEGGWRERMVAGQ